MRKLLFFIILFLGIVPCFHHHTFSITIAQKVYADDYGDEDYCDPNDPHQSCYCDAFDPSSSCYLGEVGYFGYYGDYDGAAENYYYNGNYDDYDNPNYDPYDDIDLPESSFPPNTSLLPDYGPMCEQNYEGSCVFMNMVLAGDMLGLSYSEDGLISAFATSMGRDPSVVETDGVAGFTELDNFVSTYFSTTLEAVNDIPYSLDSGLPVLATIIDGIYNGVTNAHEITIIGYDHDTSGNLTFDYVDTISGQQSTANANQILHPLELDTY